MMCLSVIGSDRIATVGEVFSECDPKLLLDVVLDCEAGWDIPFRELGSTAKSVLFRRMCSTLGLMGTLYKCCDECEMEAERPFFDFGPESYSYSSTALSGDMQGHPTPSQELIIPWETFEVVGANGELMRSVNARILHCEAMEDARAVIRSVGGRICSLREMAKATELLDGIDPLTKMIETNLASPIDNLIGEPWNKTLRRNIWLPSSLCSRELYSVLASVFWAMTYSGLSSGEFDFSNADNPFDASADPIPPSFYSDFENKLDCLADVLNFNSWVDSVESVSRLCAKL